MNKKAIISLTFILLGIGFISSMITSEATKPYTTAVEDCNDGCIVANKCLAIGQQFSANETNYYCNPDKSITAQKDIGYKCEQNYECTTDLCAEDKCTTLQEYEKKPLSSFWEKIKKIFFSLKPSF